MAVDNSGGNPIFLHTLMPGAASHSFGVAVAKLAGVPESVIDKAKALLVELEKRNVQSTNQSNGVSHMTEKKGGDNQVILVNGKEERFIEELKNLDIYKLTPLDALNTLAQFKERLGNS